MKNSEKTPKSIAVVASRELTEIFDNLNEDQIEKRVDKILSAKRVFVCGAGRSMLMLRAFAMRLMHIGIDAYVVGDTITPAYGKDDLIIFGSASGETGGLVRIANTAKKIGGNIACISIFEDSSLAKLSEVTVAIKSYTDKLPESDKNKPNILPGGSMFEIAMLILLDSMIIKLGEHTHVDTNKYFDRHANLE